MEGEWRGSGGGVEGEWRGSGMVRGISLFERR